MTVDHAHSDALDRTQVDDPPSQRRRRHRGRKPERRGAPGRHEKRRFRQSVTGCKRRGVEADLAEVA